MRLLRRCFAVTSVLMLASVLEATAGANAGAYARMYWQTGTAEGSDSAIAFSGTPQLLVTVKGVTDVRGADIGIVMGPCVSPLLPGAWLGNGTGGCNDGNWTFYVGGPGGVYPDYFAAAPAVQGIVVTSNQEHSWPGQCGSPTEGTGYLWMHVDGSAGALRDPDLEYAIWAIKFDVRETALGGPESCAGDLSDPGGAQGLYFGVCNLFPCSGPMYGAYVAIIDGTGAVDYAPVAGPHSLLYWRRSPSCVPASRCQAGTFAAKPGTWGRVRRMYR
jgi:hypothetical protein